MPLRKCFGSHSERRRRISLLLFLYYAELFLSAEMLKEFFCEIKNIALIYSNEKETRWPKVLARFYPHQTSFKILQRQFVLEMCR